MALAKRRFRPMGFGDILDEAFDLYKNNFVLLVGIAALFYMPIQFISGMTVLPLLNQLQTTTSPANIDWAKLLGSSLALGALFLMGYAAVMGAFTHAVSRRYLDEPTTISKSYGFIFRRLWALLLTIILSTLAIMGPFFVAMAVGAGAMAAAGPVVGVILFVLLLIGAAVFTILASLRLPFVTAAFVVEGLRPVAALKRSWQLATGNAGRIFGVTFVAGLIVAIVSSILKAPVQWLLMASITAGSTSALAINSAVDAVLSSVLGPITSIVLILLYYDLRIRKEGFDLQMLARDLAAASGQPLAEPSYQPSADAIPPPSVAPSDAPRCAYCRFLIYEPEESTTCSSCGAVFHSSCWAEGKGCTTPGCPAAPTGGGQQP